jgi:peptidoglycan biosynthesis protein MviN/MurJ (putative lipid II flippase)
LFPALSAAAAAGDRGRFVTLLRSNVITIALLTSGAAVVLFVVGGRAIEVLLGGGAFDAEDIARTSLLLSVFAFSVPLESLVYPLSRAAYATRNTLLPVLAGLAGLGATVVATVALRGPLGLAAVPAGFAIGVGVRVTLLTAIVAVRVRQLPALAAEDLARAD